MSTMILTVIGITGGQALYAALGDWRRFKRCSAVPREENRIAATGQAPQASTLSVLIFDSAIAWTFDGSPSLFWRHEAESTALPRYWLVLCVTTRSQGWRHFTMEVWIFSCVTTRQRLFL